MEKFNNKGELVVQVVSAFVAANALPRSELLELIATMHAAITRLTKGESIPPPLEKLEPAVSPRKSIMPDYLICLEDGRRFKTLKRHLGQLGLTPETYRAKWNLPRDYPMVAPNHAAKRSASAKKMGLGRIRRKASL